MPNEPSTPDKRTQPSGRLEGALRPVNARARVIRSRFRDDSALRVCGTLLLQGFRRQMRRG